MPGTFSQIYIQVVFAVKGRENRISNNWNTELHKYIAGIIKGKEQKPIIVNGMPDHIHAVVRLRPAMALSGLVRDIKNNSSNFINDRKLVKGKFSWARGVWRILLFSFHISKPYIIIFLTRKGTIKGKHLKRNTFNF